MLISVFNKQKQAGQNHPNKVVVVPKDKRIVPEDYFRVLKQRKEADTRKARPLTAAVTSNRSNMESANNDRAQSPDRYRPYLQHLINVIHPDMEEDEALALIELPQETMYVIDKVVRQKAKAGPIGIDNSEFINIEIEEEFKEKNQYLQNLVDGYNKKKTIQHDNDQEESDEDQDENKENQHNQRLLDRLSTVAARLPGNSSNPALLTNNFNNQSHISGGKNTTLNHGSIQQQQRSQIGERSAAAISHEEWMRRKEHETKLKEQLIREEKRDVLEEVRKAQAAEEVRRQEKHHRMMEWEDQKRLEEERKRYEKYQKEELERLRKHTQKDAAYRVFKEWLKQSLLKQRDETIDKKFRDKQKKDEEDREKKAQANKRIMARIAYKEWKEKKQEEERLKRKVERQMQREQIMTNGGLQGYGDRIQQLRRQNAIINPSTYNSENGVMLAYGLNKNLKKLRDRPKSAKPIRSKKAGGHFQQNHQYPSGMQH